MVLLLHLCKKFPSVFITFEWPHPSLLLYVFDLMLWKFKLPAGFELWSLQWEVMMQTTRSPQRPNFILGPNIWKCYQGYKYFQNWNLKLSPSLVLYKTFSHRWKKSTWTTSSTSKALSLILQQQQGIFKAVKIIQILNKNNSIQDKISN